MNTTEQTVKYIDKELISTLKFPAEEVLKTDELRRRRSENLQMGMKLGNNYRGKVKIIFEDSEGVKGVETTIWVTTDKNITLKGGMFIPIHRILDIKIY